MCPLITVVIPVYNVELFLDRCLTSVVNQTYKNLEIILVDDGSTDKSPQMCDEWAKKDERIRVFHKQNEGAGLARNCGIDNANGQYIFFFDSDDFVDETVVEKCVSNAQQYNSDVVLYGRGDAYADGRIVKKKIDLKKHIFEQDDVKNELLAGLFVYEKGYGVSTCDKMYKLDVIKRFNCRMLSEREIASEDACFTLDFFSYISKATLISDNLYFYFKREQSSSRTFKEDRQDKNDAFLHKALWYVEDRKLPKKINLYVTARYHIYTLSAMKLLLVSDLSKKEKNIKLKEMFCNPVLRSSLKFDVIKIHKKTLKLFFTLLKFRCYSLCKAMLYIKIKN